MKCTFLIVVDDSTLPTLDAQLRRLEFDTYREMMQSPQDLDYTQELVDVLNIIAELRKNMLVRLRMLKRGTKE